MIEFYTNHDQKEEAARIKVLDAYLRERLSACLSPWGKGAVGGE